MYIYIYIGLFQFLEEMSFTTPWHIITTLNIVV